MEHVQDGITYKIKDGLLKGWKGNSPFKRPIWDGEKVVESWTEQDQTEADEQSAIQAQIDALRQSPSTIGVYQTPDGSKFFAVTIDNNGKIETAEIK